MSTEEFKLVFYSDHTSSVSSTGSLVTLYINYLYVSHPEWFYDIQEYALYFLFLKGRCTKEADFYKENGLLDISSAHKDKFITSIGSKDECKEYKTILTPMSSFSFQFSPDNTYKTKCTIENVGDYMAITNAYDKPYVARKFSFYFSSKEHLLVFSKLYESYYFRKVQDKTGHTVYMNEKLWKSVVLKSFPTIQNIFIKGDMKEAILKKIDSFKNLQARAEKFGKPCKFNMLLHGVPGSGKTSLAKAIANHYKKRLYILSFSKEMTDTDLSKLLSEIFDNSILVLEDIDSFFVQRESKCNISFSCLLNVLDGVTNVDKNLITILTANYPENLDSALLRPGRIDLLVKFEYPEKDEIFAAFKAYTELPEDTVTKEFNKFYKHIKGLKCPMSLITDYLFHHQYDYIDCIHELLQHHDDLKQIINDKSEKMYL
jgi:AAA+ superfamily predicted ATPase